MRVRYLGTAAAEGIPALFCRCAFCQKARSKGEVRTRSQIVVDGELSIDFPPDAFSHAAVQDFTALRYLLVTHSHMDHFYAHDFVLHGYKYAHGAQELSLYGNEEVLQIFRECTAREMREDVAPTISLHEIRAFEEVRFGDWRVLTLPAKHSSRAPLLFLIERGGKRLLHLCDTGGLTAEAEAFLAERGGLCDIVDLDCTFLFGETLPQARHMGLDEDMRTLARLRKIGIVGKDTKAVITHFSHNASPAKEALERAEREYGVIAAYDGMELSV